MAMSGNALGAQLAAAVAGLSDAQKGSVAEIWKVIGTAIVAHIQTSAVVTTTGTAAAQSGTIS